MLGKLGGIHLCELRFLPCRFHRSAYIRPDPRTSATNSPQCRLVRILPLPPIRYTTRPTSGASRNLNTNLTEIPPAVRGIPTPAADTFSEYML